MSSTKTTTPSTTALETSRTDVLSARRLLQDWEDRAARAERKREDLQRDLGTAVLDSADQGAAIRQQLVEVEQETRTAEAAATAQRTRLAAAERAYCAELADHLEVTELQPAREALAEHKAKVGQLVAQLTELEDTLMVALPDHEMRRRLAPRGEFGLTQTFYAPVSERLARVVTTAERHVEVSRLMADGEDPTPKVHEWILLGGAAEDCYPAEMLGAQAVVPAPPYAARIDHAREVLRELESLRGSLPGEITELEEAARDHCDPLKQATAERLRGRLEELPDEIDQARERLVSLTAAG